MTETQLICKVRKNKTSGQLLIYVPKNAGIVEGDYVHLIKIINEI